MDSLFIYTARRSLVSGHSVLQQYTYETCLMEDTQPRRKVDKTIARSCGGNTETLLDKADMEWTIVFEPARGEKLARLREFLDSTEGGESFQAYLYGTESTPLTLVRTDDGYSISPYRREGAAERDWFQLSITAIEVDA